LKGIPAIAGREPVCCGKYLVLHFGLHYQNKIFDDILQATLFYRACHFMSRGEFDHQVATATSNPIFVEAVKSLFTLFPNFHQSRNPQDCQMVGYSGLADTQVRDDLIHR
jgi:hypothetical protein